MIARVAVSALFAALLSTDASAETLTERQLQGKKLFEATCNYCHNARGWATERLRTRLDEARVVIAERKDLDRNYIRFVIRNGLVNMPAYTPTDLSDAQIQIVAEYLTREKN